MIKYWPNMLMVLGCGLFAPILREDMPFLSIACDISALINLAFLIWAIFGGGGADNE